MTAAADAQPLTAGEVEIRQSLAATALDQPLLDSWGEHQPWCAYTQSGCACTCGVWIVLWFAGPTRLAMVGFDLHPIIFEKQ